MNPEGSQASQNIDGKGEGQQPHSGLKLKEDDVIDRNRARTSRLFHSEGQLCQSVGKPSVLSLFFLTLI